MQVIDKGEKREEKKNDNQKNIENVFCIIEGPRLKYPTEVRPGVGE